MAAKDILKQILDDKGTYKDDMVVTLATGQTVAIGDLRSLSSDQQATLAARETKIAKDQADLQKNLETLQLAQAETARLFAEVNESKTKLLTESTRQQPSVPDPFEKLANDPLLGPMVKTLKKQEETIAALQDKTIKPIAEAMSRMAQAYVNDRVADIYERIVPEDKQDALKLADVLKYANDNKLATSSGIPDIRKAYREMTTKPMTQADIDKQLADARAAGRKEAEDASRLRVPRPMANIGGPRSDEAAAFKPTNRSSVSGALDEAFAAAVKDSSIWAQVDGAN